MTDQHVKPYPIDFIRVRVERQAREQYIYDSVETATADRAELLQWFDTERTLHNAWRKRAEEAEVQLTAQAAQLEQLQKDLDESLHSGVLQAVLDAIKGTLDPHTQIADHPNVKFAQMERLKWAAELDRWQAKAFDLGNGMMEAMTDRDTAQRTVGEDRHELQMFDKLATDLWAEGIAVKAQLAAQAAQLETVRQENEQLKKDLDESLHSGVLQAVLDAIAGTLDPSTQIADHPNVKFAQMQRLHLLKNTPESADRSSRGTS